jgi:hypothetical protein
MLKYLFGAAMLTMCAVSALAMDQHARIVIYDGVATVVTVASEPSSDLLVTTSDLTRATRFVIKPQGVCRDQLCFPLPKNRKAEFVSKFLFCVQSRSAKSSGQRSPPAN